MALFVILKIGQKGTPTLGLFSKKNNFVKCFIQAKKKVPLGLSLGLKMGYQGISQFKPCLEMRIY